MFISGAEMLMAERFRPPPPAGRHAASCRLLLLRRHCSASHALSVIGRVQIRAQSFSYAAGEAQALVFCVEQSAPRSFHYKRGAGSTVRLCYMRLPLSSLLIFYSQRRGGAATSFFPPC